jgi:hypothetical protein
VTTKTLTIGKPLFSWLWHISVFVIQILEGETTPTVVCLWGGRMLLWLMPCGLSIAEKTEHFTPQDGFFLKAKLI